MSNKDGRIRKNVLIGSQVQIILKQDQKNRHLTKGTIEALLTNAEKHPHGIKVRLRSGKVGRIQKILSVPKKERSGNKIETEERKGDSHLFSIQGSRPE